MKKILRILLILVLVVLALLIVTPLLFKKQLLEKAREVANTSVNARVDFRDFKLGWIEDNHEALHRISGYYCHNLWHDL